MKWWDRMPWSSFSECWALKPTFSLSSFTLIERLFSSSSLSAIKVVSSAYLRFLIFLLAILIPAWASSSLAFSWCTLHISWISRVTISSLDVLLFLFGTSLLFHDFPGGSDGKASVYNAGDPGLIPQLGRSPGEGNGNHSSTIAWKIPWTEEPRRLQSMGSQRVRHD